MISLTCYRIFRITLQQQPIVTQPVSARVATTRVQTKDSYNAPDESEANDICARERIAKGRQTGTHFTLTPTPPVAGLQYVSFCIIANLLRFRQLFM